MRIWDIFDTCRWFVGFGTFVLGCLLITTTFFLFLFHINYNLSISILIGILISLLISIEIIILMSILIISLLISINNYLRFWMNNNRSLPSPSSSSSLLSSDQDWPLPDGNLNFRYTMLEWNTFDTHQR